MTSIAMLPSEATIWTALVLRAPDAAWDGRRYSGSKLSSIDETGIAGITEPFQVIRSGQFLAVAAPSPAVAELVASALNVKWETSLAIDSKASKDLQRPPAEQATYIWPADQWLAPYSVSSLPVASWHDQTLQVWGACDDPIRLRQELALLLAMEETEITIHGNTSHSGTGHFDAAVDSAILSRTLSRPVRVIPTPSSPPKTLAINLQLHSGAAGAEQWTTASDYPCTPRPSWASITTGIESSRTTSKSSVEADDGIYDVEVLNASAKRALPIDISLDRRSVAMATTFSRESFVDELATSRGMDPVEWRLDRLADRSGRSVIEEVVQRSRWRAPRESQSCRNGKGRGFAYASVTDRSTPSPARAWSAWVVDLTVNPSGKIDIDGITVGHHIDGLAPARDFNEPAIREYVDRTARQLLHSPQAHDDWSTNGARLKNGELPPPAVPASSLSDAAASNPPRALSTSEALTLPAAAAVANAIFDATGVRLRQPPFEIVSCPANPEAGAKVVRARLKRVFAWAGSTITAAAGVAALALPWRAPIAPVTPDVTVYSAEAIQRGRLIAAASDCVVCHTAPGGQPNAGGLALQTPFGKIYSTNITPDAETGIGKWSFSAFDRAMRQGIGRDGRHLYPAFPYTSFAKFSDGDMQALYAYLMSQTPVSFKEPATKLAFPYNLRFLMAGWNLLFHGNSRFVPDKSQSAAWNRGAYLVQGAGHCGACHTPRNVFGAEKSSIRYFLGGAFIEGWEAPALNELSNAPLKWTQQDMFDYLRTGFSSRHGVATGPMAPVIEGLQVLPDSDILAMATFLTQPPIATTVTQPLQPTPAGAPDAPHGTAPAKEALIYSALPGHSLYEGACAACHDATRGTPLFGVRPDMRLNSSINSVRPDNLIHVILDGITNPPNTALGYMPPFRDRLNDTQIAELVVYMRERFATASAPWTDVEDTVRRIRAMSHDHLNAEKL